MNSNLMPAVERAKNTLANRMNVAKLEVTSESPKSKNQFVVSVEESGVNLNPNSNLYPKLGTRIQSKQFSLDASPKILDFSVTERNSYIPREAITKDLNH